MRKYPVIFSTLLIVATSILWMIFVENNNYQNSSFPENHQEQKFIFQENEISAENFVPISIEIREAELSSKTTLSQVENLNLPKLNKEIRTFEEALVTTTSLRQILDEINGNFDSLDTKMIFSLAQNLNICISKPRTQPERNEYEHNYYFVSGGKKSDMDFFHKRCSAVTDEELAMAYPLMERAANAGLPDAVLSYSFISEIPGYTVDQAHSFEEETPENQLILSRHNEKSTRMLNKLVENGSLSAVFNLGHNNNAGLQQPVNKKKSPHLFFSLCRFLKSSPISTVDQRPNFPTI